MEAALSERRGYTVGFRDIARSTDIRTMIASIVPWAGYGNTAPLLTSEPDVNVGLRLRLAANLNAICLDFVARQKAQGTQGTA